MLSSERKQSLNNIIMCHDKLDKLSEISSPKLQLLDENNNNSSAPNQNNYGSINESNKNNGKRPPGETSLSDKLSHDQSLSVSIEDNQYALYSYRWLVLFAVTMFSFIAGLERSYLSVSNILYDHLDTNVEEYTQWSPMGMLVLIFLGVPLSRALDKFGLKAMAYFAANVAVLTHFLITISVMPDGHILSVPKRFRFGLFIAGNVGVQVVVATNIGFGARVAPTWFAENEATRVMMIWGSGYSVAAGLTNHFIPLMVEHEHQLDIIGYIYLSIGVFICATTFLLIRTSEPSKPPSAKAHEANEGSHAPLFKSLYVILTCPQYILVLFTSTVNNATINVLLSFLQHVLKDSGYSNAFCGDLISMFFIVGIPASFIAALTVDFSGKFVLASKVASLIHPLFFLAFSLVIQSPGQKALIVLCCLLLSLSMGLVVQSFIQVQLRASTGIIAGSSVMAMANIILGIVFTSMCSIFAPLRHLSPPGHENVVPLNIFAIFNISANFIYVLLFNMPNKAVLRSKMRCDIKEKKLISTESIKSEDRFRYVDQA